MVKQQSLKKKNPIIYGIFSGVFLFLVYFLVLSLANSFSHAISQLISMWYWIVLLVLSFEVQVGLYISVKNSMMVASTATTEVATAGGISTGSMIACCAHHLTDVLPFLGFSAAALFLVQYQIPFIILGIFSNLVGITMMLSVIQQHQLPIKNRMLQELFRYNFCKVRNWTIGVSVVIVGIVFIFAAFGSVTQMELPVKKEIVASSLPIQTNSEGSLDITAQPIEFSSDEKVKFEIVFNTHQGSLDFEVPEISGLKDNLGNYYSAILWEGSPAGGHHRTGILTFPNLKENASNMTLTLKDIYGIPERVFSWKIT